MRYKDGIFIKSLKLIPSTFLSYVTKESWERKRNQRQELHVILLKALLGYHHGNITYPVYTPQLPESTAPRDKVPSRGAI